MIACKWSCVISKFLCPERFLQTHMGLLMSGGVESKLNFVGEVLKGCDERSWLGLDIWRDGSCFFVPTLMTVHRTHLLFHLSRDRCWHSAFSSVPTRSLLLSHLTIRTWTSQPCTDFCFEHVWAFCDKTELHFMGLPCPSLPMFHGREQESSSPSGTRCPSMRPQEKCKRSEVQS